MCIRDRPGEGDADLPEDEQPSGEEPDPDEDEEIPENEPEDEPFEAVSYTHLDVYKRQPRCL